MTMVTHPPSPARRISVPNLLTYARMAAVPVVIGSMYWSDFLGGGLWLHWVALAVFIAAGVTDFFDGYFARVWGQQTTFGRMLDPIADKLLVASCLLMLAGNGTIKGLTLWAAVVILCREILVSGLREYLAGLRVSVPVTRLAKWKTGFQMGAIGTVLAGDSSATLLHLGWLPVTAIGESMLWIAAVLTLVTGWEYVQASLNHAGAPRGAEPGAVPD